MDTFDYDAFVADLKKRKAYPLIVLYGIPSDGGGTDLDWLSTDAYDNGDKTLQADANKAIEAVSRQING